MSTNPSRDSGGTAGVLPFERSKSTFDVATLRSIITGKRPEIVDKFRPLFTGPEFDASMDHFESYPALFEKQLSRAASAIKVIRDNPKLMIAHQAQKVSMRELFDTGSLGIHFVAYLPFLQTQANEEQKKMWLPGAINAEYFGAYCQTELGHGSNVRALETTATFDKSTDEFVIHSPTLTSMKWWPTGLYASTHGVVFAQLIIDGKSHGVFGFFMQFRDEDGKLLPGVEIGEIGPKVGPRETNIGYARFDHVRVPRTFMFSKHSQVTRDGQFIAAPKKLSKFKYVGMMNIRAILVAGAAQAVSQAATIAIRYSCVRKQGFKNSKTEDDDATSALKSGENAIIDYKFQQYRVFKALGAGYLMLWTGRNVREYLQRVVQGVASGDETSADELPDLHATCAGLKAWCTTWASDMVEDCRKACGGQGFLRSSGISDMSTNYVGAVTAEGEAVILALQTARYIIKNATYVANSSSNLSTDVVNGKVSDPKLASSVDYLRNQPLRSEYIRDSIKGTGSFIGQHKLVLALFAERARRVAFDMSSDFNDAIKRGMSFDEALNSVAVSGWHANECHCFYNMARNAFEAIPKFVSDEKCRNAVTNCVELVLLQIISESGSDFLDVLNHGAMRMIGRDISRLLDIVRPDAVALSDSFGIADHVLDSTIGRYDGNVYEAIYEAAKKSPLNVDRMVGWDKLKPMLDMDFMREMKKQQRQGQFSKL